MAISRTRAIAGSVATGSTTSITLPSAPASGQVAVLQISVNSGTSARVSSISQSGVTWTKHVEAYNGPGSIGIETWVGVVGSEAGTVITINFATSLANVAHYAEYSGVDTTSPVVATGSSIDDSGLGAPL
jgi:hypothetical protein